MSDPTNDEIAAYLSGGATPSGTQESFDGDVTPDEINSYLGGDSSSPSQTPETDKALWEQVRDLAKTPSPAWMQPFEQTVRKVATTAPQIPVSPESSGPMRLLGATVNPLLGFATLENAALGAAWAVQPEIGAALTAAKMAPGVAPWWQQVKRLPEMTPEEGLKLGMETWPLIAAPFIHPAAKEFKPTETGVRELTPAGFIRKYGDAPEDLRERPPTPEEDFAPPPEEKPKPPVVQETDEASQARFEAARKRLTMLGGDWEHIHQSLAEERGQNPTYGELADEMEDEIKDLTSSVDATQRNLEIGLAKKRTQQNQERENANAEAEGREPNKVPNVTPAQIRAEYADRIFIEQQKAEQQRQDATLSRQELQEEQRAKKGGGRYARKVGSPTSLSEPEIRSLLGQETRVRQPRPTAGARSPGAQPVPAPERPVATETAPPQAAPEPVKPTGPLWEKAQKIIHERLGLPNEPKALMRRLTEFQREDDPSFEELDKMYRSEYEKLRRQEAAPKTETPASAGAGTATTVPTTAHGGVSREEIGGREAQPSVKPGTFKVKRGPRDQFANSPETPVANAVSEAGGILSKSGAKRGGKLEGNEALWDDLPKFASLTHQKIYNLNGEMPDVMAQNLYDAGLIKEPSVDAMYRELERESHTIKGAGTAEKKAAKERQAPEKQAENFGKGQRKEAEAGTPAVPASALNVGDVVTVDGHPLKVVDVHPDDFTVTLENGKKYGIQEVSDNDVVYGEHESSKATTPQEEFVPEPPIPGESPAEARAKAFERVPGQTSTYRHKITNLIVRGSRVGERWKWEAIHPETNEVLNTETSRRRALDANLSGSLEKPEPPPEIKATETAKAADKAATPEHDFSTMEGFVNAIKERFDREPTEEEKKALEPFVREVQKIKSDAQKARSNTIREILHLFEDTRDIPWEDAVKQIHDAISKATTNCGG